ncbi:HNH endonuclease [bacterium]|nr:HNH endonuclease [bacterium]
MILTKTVDIQVSSSNKLHFENLGYTFPIKWSISNRKNVVPRGTNIKVNVKDLKKNSNIEIEYECDICKNIIKSIYCKYINKKLNDDLCHSCYMTSYRVGKNHPMSYKLGNLNPNWHSYKTNDERDDDRSHFKYKKFIRNCFVRDNYTCQISGQYGGDLVVHHIHSYAKYPKVRYDINNGITLSRKIHNEFHKKYSKVKFTSNDFIIFKENYSG